MSVPLPPPITQQRTFSEPQGRGEKPSLCGHLLLYLMTSVAAKPDEVLSPGPVFSKLVTTAIQCAALLLLLSATRHPGQHPTLGCAHAALAHRATMPMAHADLYRVRLFVMVRFPALQ